MQKGILRRCHYLRNYDCALNRGQRSCGNHLSGMLAGHNCGPRFLHKAFYNSFCLHAYHDRIGGCGGYTQCPYASFCHTPLVCWEGDVWGRRFLRRCCVWADRLRCLTTGLESYNSFPNHLCHLPCLIQWEVFLIHPNCNVGAYTWVKNKDLKIGFSSKPLCILVLKVSMPQMHVIISGMLTMRTFNLDGYNHCCGFISSRGEFFFQCMTMLSVVISDTGRLWLYEFAYSFRAGLPHKSNFLMCFSVSWRVRQKEMLREKRINIIIINNFSDCVSCLWNIVLACYVHSHSVHLLGAKSPLSLKPSDAPAFHQGRSVNRCNQNHIAWMTMAGREVLT